MKFGPVEGTPEEIKDFIANNGLKPTDYFEPASTPISNTWLIVPGVCLMITLVLLALIKPSDGLGLLLFICGFAAAIWLSVSAQIRFNNPWATSFLIVCFLGLLLVACGAVTPRQMLEEAKSLREK